MYRNQSHETWGLPLMVFLLISLNLAAQCPLTKSAAYAMVPIGNTSTENLQPSDFFLNSSDTLSYSNLQISRNNFACADLGIQEIELSGISPDGNSFSCQELVWVYDSVFLCNPTINNPKVVAGQIHTETNAVVPNIVVGLSTDDQYYFNGTDENGKFLFPDLSPLKYLLTPDLPFDNNYRNGITTFDVLILQKHILGILKLDSPYKLIAADLNNSGDISVFDMVLLRQMILSTIEEFPNRPSWIFVDASYEFDDPKNPFQEDYPTYVLIDLEKQSPQLDNRFIAIKMGDLNNSVSLQPNARRRASDIAKASIKIEDKSFSKGEIVTVPLSLSQKMNIAGLQLTLNYDVEQLELLEISGLNDFSNQHYFDQEGTVMISWTHPFGYALDKEDSPIHMTFRSIQNGQLSPAIQLNNSIQENEFYTGKNEIVPFSLNWENKQKKTIFKAFDNYPNPFSIRTSIPFVLSENSEISLQILDAIGKSVFTKKKTYVAGNQVFEFDGDLPVSGIYFYKLESKLGVATGRLNYVK